MTDTAHNEPVRVTAEERPHPALQKLARACIALARLRHEKAPGQPDRPADERPLASAGDDPAEVCHG